MKKQARQIKQKRAHNVFTEIITKYCLHTGMNTIDELKNIPNVEYTTYGGNMMAITTFLGYALCQINIHETFPDTDEQMDSEGGSILVTEFMNRQLLIEVLDHKYPRLRSQLELEALINETGGVYLVVNDFFDFITQLYKLLENASS